MSFFDDIGSAIGSVVGDVASAGGAIASVASGIVNSGIGQTVLGIGGSLFGDPGLGAQLGGLFKTASSGLRGISSLFSGGGGHAPALRPAPTRAAPGFTGWKKQSAKDGSVWAIGYRAGRVAAVRKLRAAPAPVRYVPVVPKPAPVAKAPPGMVSADAAANLVSALDQVDLSGHALLNAVSQANGGMSATNIVNSAIYASSIAPSIVPVDVPDPGRTRTRNL